MTVFGTCRMLPLILVAVFVALIGITILIVTNATSASPGAQVDLTSDENYTFDLPEPGSIFHVKFEQFKRYGPLRDAIIADQDRLLGPENSITEGWSRIGPNGETTDITVEVSSADGQPWYSYSSPEGDRYQVVNHRNNKQQDGGLIPVIPSQLEDAADRPHYADVFKRLGWQMTGEASFNGRATLVFELSGPILEPQIPSTGDGFELPVMYDLDGISIRNESHVDAASGIVLQSYRYLVDSVGQETLLESFKLLISRQEG